MALTLVDMRNSALARGDDLTAAYIQTFLMQVPLMAAMQFEDIPGDTKSYEREVSLGSVEARAIGGSYTESTGKNETLFRKLKIFGGDMDVDRFLIQTQGAQRRDQERMKKAKLLGQTIAYQFLKGSVTTAGGATASIHGIDGLQVRYGGGFGSTAVVDSGVNAGQILLNGGGSQALSLKSLDGAIQATENPTHILMSKTMLPNLTAFLRGSASLAQSRDEFSRLVTSYNGLPIIEADALGTVSGLEALGFNENNESSTSVWILSIGDGALRAVQNGAISVRDLGEQQTKPAYRDRVEWYLNLVDEHPRCVTRLYSVANLTAVA